MSEPDQESALLERIGECVGKAARAALIDELDRTPVGRYPFYRRWERIYEAFQTHGETPDGLGLPPSQWPRDIQLLGTASFGRCVVRRWGFHEFFVQGDDEIVPETVEWCQRAGIVQAAELVREAEERFKPLVPIEQDEEGEREEQGNSPDDQKGWWESDQIVESFRDLNRRFSQILSDSIFDAAADRWLREICGIQNLHQLPPNIVLYHLVAHCAGRAFWEYAIDHPGTRPIEQTLPELLPMTRSSIGRIFGPDHLEVRVSSLLGDHFLLTFRREEADWRVTDFVMNGTVRLFDEPDGARYRALADHVLQACRESLVPSGPPSAGAGR